MKDETKYFFKNEVIVRNVTLVKLYAKKAKCGDKARDICKADDLLSCNDVKPVYYAFSGIEDLNFAIPSVRAKSLRFELIYVDRASRQIRRCLHGNGFPSFELGAGCE